MFGNAQGVHFEMIIVANVVCALHIVRALHVVCARADVVATKLGIILLLSSFLPHTFLPEGVCLGS